MPGKETPVPEDMSTVPAAEPRLPAQLAGAKPRYSYGSKQFNLQFESDVDRALYIVAQAKPSKQDAAYMEFLRQALPGKSDEELRQMGQAVRARIKGQAASATDTTVPLRVLRAGTGDASAPAAARVPRRTPRVVNEEVTEPRTEPVPPEEAATHPVAEPSAPETPAPDPDGRLPRLAGEPKTIPIAGGEGKPVEQLRREAPAGYRLSVPEDGPPVYRRVLTQADMDWAAEHPAPGEFSGRTAYGEGMDDPEEVLDTFAGIAARSHPRWSTPREGLTQDWKKFRQATSWKLWKLYRDQILESMGVDASEWKDLDADIKSQISKDAYQRAKKALKEVETEVTSDEWHSRLVELKNQGFPEGRPTGGVGGRVEEPSGLPPEPPTAEPPGVEPPNPQEPGLGNPQRALGQDGPRVDLLDGQDREKLIQAEKASLESSRGAGKRAWDKVRRKARSLAVEAVRTEKERTDQTAMEQIDDQVDTIRFNAEKAGLNVSQNDTGDWVLKGFSEEVPMEDVVEQATDAGRRVYGELNDDQRAVIDDIRRVNEWWNKTIEAHGGTVPMRDSIEGQYFPRRVASREVSGGEVARNTPAGTSRRLGGSRIGTRTQESVAAGIEEGLTYQNPWDALKGGMKTKARIAQDNYLANLIKPLAVPEAQAGFGYRTLKDSHPLLTTNRAVGHAFDGENVVVNHEPMVFPNEIADQLDDVLSSRSILDSKPAAVVQAIHAAATPVRASMDVSFMLNQGLAFMESGFPSPAGAARRGAQAVGGGYQVVRSAMGDPQRYAALRTAERERATGLLQQAGVEDVPGNEWLRRRGVHYSGEGNIGEFQFPEWMQKVPVLGDAMTWSNETFSRYLNYARDVLANDELERAVSKGLRGDELVAHMEAAAPSINRMTGWTASRPTGLETIGAFAPRFFRANMEQILAAATRGGIEGEIARKQFYKLFGIAVPMVTAINSARGYNTDLDPRSNNFLRIRDVGGQDVSMLGPFATTVRAAAQSLGGQAGQASDGPRGHGFVVGTNALKPNALALPEFARTKASPVAGTLWDLVSGKTFDQRPVERNPGDLNFYTGTLPNLAAENLPFTGQALVRTGPLGALASSTGLTASEVTAAEHRDIARDKTASRMFGGRTYPELLASEKSQVNQDKSVKHWADVQTQRGLDKGDMKAQIDDEYATKLEANAKFLKEGKDAAGKPFSGVDYRHAFDDAADAKRNQMKGAGIDIKGDSVLDGYFALYDQAKMANGQIDYDAFDRLAASYTAQHPDVTAKIEKFVGVNDDATAAALRKARAQAKAYYEIPKYMGMSVEQGEKSDAAISAASVLTQNGIVGTREAAFARLIADGKLTADQVALARQASQMQSNPARRQFLAANPEFAIFYRGVDDSMASEAGMVPAGASGGSSSSGGFKYGGATARRKRLEERRAAARRRKRRR